MNVEDIDVVAEQGIGAVPGRPRAPLPLSGHGVQGDPPEVLDLGARGISDIDTLHEPLELLGIALFVRGAEERGADSGITLGVELEPVERPGVGQ